MPFQEEEELVDATSQNYDNLLHLLKMIRHLALSLFIASALAHRAGDQSPADASVQDAAQPEIVKLPNKVVNCYGGDTARFNDDKLTKALLQAWECSPGGKCFSAGGNSYPSVWDNRGITGNPRWTCGGAEAANPINEFPIMKEEGVVFPPADQKPGKYRVYYSVESSHVPTAATLHYCGVAQHDGEGNHFVKCDGSTVAAATATPHALEEL